jgi:nucleosome binding factor SPN SPT16 subunit
VLYQVTLLLCCYLELISSVYMKNKVGVLPKDTTTGPFAEDWKRTFAMLSAEIEEVDISPALSAAFVVKDTDELVR